AGIPETLNGLHTHIFNSTVYPDFFSHPDSACPVLVGHSLQLDQEWTVDGLRIIPISDQRVYGL
ncbi:MAG: hypothetical protein ABI604_16760, partial [Nitrospirota bacterium]